MIPINTIWNDTIHSHEVCRELVDAAKFNLNSHTMCRVWQLVFVSDQRSATSFVAIKKTPKKHGFGR